MKFGYKLHLSSCSSDQLMLELSKAANLASILATALAHAPSAALVSGASGLLCSSQTAASCVSIAALLGLSLLGLALCFGVQTRSNPPASARPLVPSWVVVVQKVYACWTPLIAI